jgi:hypothetical protein
METNNIDSLFRKTVEESAEYYEFEAEQSKGSIWQQIKPGNNIPALPVLFRFLLAACVLLLFCSTYLAILLSREKNNVRMLAEAYRISGTESFHQRPHLQTEKVMVAHANVSDTVYIKRDVIVYQPVITTEKQTDTIYIRQVVYPEKEQIPEVNTAKQDYNIKESINPVKDQSSAKEIIISNKLSRDAGKKRKILLKLGGYNNSVWNGSPVFTVNL